MLIVFEGIDNSGKSTLSKKFAEYLNTPEGVALIKSANYPGFSEYLGFRWTKEPQFTTEEADRLNSPEFKDPAKREAFFFADRMRHQGDLEDADIICDRYVWTGAAYAKKFSRENYPLVKELYFDPSIFIQPDLYIFVDTPLEVCDKRDPSVGLLRLKDIRAAYASTKKYAAEHSDIIYTSAGDGIEESLKKLIEVFRDYLKSL
jgi:thymidylate kinase